MVDAVKCVVDCRNKVKQLTEATLECELDSHLADDIIWQRPQWQVQKDGKKYQRRVRTGDAAGSRRPAYGRLAPSSRSLLDV